MSNKSTHRTLTRPSELSTIVDSQCTPNVRRSITSPRTMDQSQHSRHPSVQDRPQPRCERLNRGSPQRRRLQFNKWYISPKLRCVERAENIKENYRAYRDLDYFYENLHNTRFWNWKHPLDSKPFQQSRRTPRHSARQALKAKLNIRMLEGFRKNLKQDRHRLPHIVQEMLST